MTAIDYHLHEDGNSTSEPGSGSDDSDEGGSDKGDDDDDDDDDDGCGKGGGEPCDHNGKDRDGGKNVSKRVST